MTKRSPTTKDIGLLHQLYKSGQLTLAPEFQRNAVWPARAKAYLIDTILNDRPIPLLFFQRSTSAQKGLQSYTVIDGQQRLRAIMEFIEGRFRLTQSAKNQPYYNKRFSELPDEFQEIIRNYDLVIAELTGYTDSDIRDMFVRFNKYVVKLAPQELRHAKGTGKFHDFVERVGRWSFWKANKVFSANNLKRMRAVEFAAELTILLIEGPQDKKASVDLYYHEYAQRFPEEKHTSDTLQTYLKWISDTVPSFSESRFRRPVDLYSLIGALDQITETRPLTRLNKARIGDRLADFEAKTRQNEPSGIAARYLAAASRQTDNIIPRKTRIDILTKLIQP